jgi:hypothetical protein
MNATPRALALARCRDEVTGRMEQGHPFDEVEGAIDLADVTEDQKAALWLMAFAMRDQGEQQQDADRHLTLVADQ